MEPAIRHIIRTVTWRRLAVAIVAALVTLNLSNVDIGAMPVLPFDGAQGVLRQAQHDTGVGQHDTTTAAGTALIQYTGQLLDVQKGFVFFTTGDGFRIAPNARIVDYKTGAATGLKPITGAFARATFDGASGQIVQLELSRDRLAQSTSLGTVKRFAVTLSTPAPNPDLAPAASTGPTYSGKLVLVTFTVQVPPSTPLTDSVYISTDQSQWNPLAIRMDRIDGLHYRITREIRSGTKFHYRYTRGSFNSTERGRNGLEMVPRNFIIRDLDIEQRDDTVYHWADDVGVSQGAGPTTVLPTPFNPRPFATPRP